jgi:hypothetical protein
MYYTSVCVAGSYCGVVRLNTIQSQTTCATWCDSVYDGYTITCDDSTQGGYGCNGETGVGCAQSGGPDNTTVTLTTCDEASPSGYVELSCACAVN